MIGFRGDKVEINEMQLQGGRAYLCAKVKFFFAKLWQEKRLYEVQSVLVQ